MDRPHHSLSFASASVIGRRAMHQERLYDLGWTLPPTVADGAQARAFVAQAYDQYRLFYPEDPVSVRDIREALGLAD